MSSSRRQFGKSTFKPSFGGVGASATVRGDEENLNNAIIDDEAEADLSATTAKSSAAFLNATFSSAGSSSASAENSGDTMEVEAQETSKVDPSEEEELPASALDDVLNDDDSDSGDNEEEAAVENTTLVDNGTASPSKDAIEEADSSDSDSDDDMVGMSQVTSTQKTIDEMFDSDSDDDDLPLIPSQSQSQGAT